MCDTHTMIMMTAMVQTGSVSGGDFETESQVALHILNKIKSERPEVVF